MFQRSRIVPPLSEGFDKVANGGASDLGLDVVPGRTFAVHRVETLGLRVAFVALVVPTPVAEIDATDECDIVWGALIVQDQHELLMVRAAAANPLVQE